MECGGFDKFNKMWWTEPTDNMNINIKSYLVYSNWLSNPKDLLGRLNNSYKPAWQSTDKVT